MVDVVKILEDSALRECEMALRREAEKYAEALLKEIAVAGSSEYRDFEMALDIEGRLSSVLDILYRIRCGKIKIVAGEEEKKLLTTHKPSGTIKK